MALCPTSYTNLLVGPYSHKLPPPHLDQPFLDPDPINEPWGDPITKDILQHVFQVLSWNVNAINPAPTLLEWQAVTYALNDYSVGVACLEETNTQWTPALINCVQQVFHQLQTIIGLTLNSKAVANACRITIASRYQLCHQNTRLGSSTFHQQYHLATHGGR